MYGVHSLEYVLCNFAFVGAKISNYAVFDREILKSSSLRWISTLYIKL